MDKLRQAAEQALKRLDMYFVEHGNDDDFEATQALRQALGEPEQTVGMEEYKRLQKLVTSQGIRLMDYESQPEQEPVAWIVESKHGNWAPYLEWSEPSYLETQVVTALYTAPPKREWIGLTDDEIKEIIGHWGDTPIKGYTRRLFDQIESKLKDKNT